MVWADVDGVVAQDRIGLEGIVGLGSMWSGKSGKVRTEAEGSVGSDQEWLGEDSRAETAWVGQGRRERFGWIRIGQSGLV